MVIDDERWSIHKLKSAGERFGQSLYTCAQCALEALACQAFLARSNRSAASCQSTGSKKDNQIDFRSSSFHDLC